MQMTAIPADARVSINPIFAKHGSAAVEKAPPMYEEIPDPTRRAWDETLYSVTEAPVRRDTTWIAPTYEAANQDLVEYET